MNHDRLIHFVKRNKKKEKCNSFCCCCCLMWWVKEHRWRNIPEAQDTQGNQKVDKFLWNHGGKSSKLFFSSLWHERIRKNTHMWINGVHAAAAVFFSFETRRLKGSYYIVSWFFYFGHDASRLKCLSNRIHTSTYTHTHTNTHDQKFNPNLKYNEFNIESKRTKWIERRRKKHGGGWKKTMKNNNSNKKLLKWGKHF